MGLLSVFEEKAKHVSICLGLAILLEVSSHKPGNVNRFNNFPSTRYEHFLASAIAVTPFFERAAKKGMSVSDARIRLTNIKLGLLIKNCLNTINTWHHGGNTLLGTVILLSPIAVAAGMTPAEKKFFKIPKIRKKLKLVVESTTPEDASDVYEAIKNANPGGLGKVSELDVTDPNSKKRIHEQQVTLYDTFQIAAKYDTICSEWANNYPITFDVAYPFMIEQITKVNDLNVAIVHTFLKILAEYPDTLIARKTTLEKAKEVSYKAKTTLNLGGLETSKGKKYLNQFDWELRKAGNLLNPGTTADIIAATLALAILEGYRP